MPNQPKQNKEMKTKEELLEANKHIPSDEVRQDILDTEKEIEDLVKEIEFLRNTPATSRDYKINNFKADGKQSGIREREKFIELLRSLLCERGEHHFVECDEWERTCLYCGKFEK
jgi:hypothetical protein